MKYLNYILIITCLLIVASCSDSNQKLEKLIPENASWTIKVDLDKVLSKGHLLDKDGQFVIPDNIKNALNDNDTFAKRIILSLPSSGLKTDGNIFFFSSSKHCSSEMIALTSDVDATKKWILELTAEKSMKKNDFCDYIFDNNTLYAICDDILYIGNVNKNADAKDVLDDAKTLFNQKPKSIADKKEAASVLERDADITAFVSMRAAGSKNALRQIAAKYPMLNILSEMEIKALALTANLNKDLDIHVEIISDKNSAYSILFSALLSEPNADFLEIIPSSMESVMAISLKGEQLLKIPEFKKLLGSTASIPVIREINFNKIISTVNGPIAIGISKDPNFVNEYNFVVAAMSNNPSGVLAEINRIARRNGSTPQKSGEELIYDYFNQKITVGVKGNKYVYFKILNYNYDSSTFAAYKDVKELFGKSKIGFYAKVKAEAGDSEWMMKWTSASNISIQLRSTNNNADNILGTMIAELCKNENSNSSYDDNNEEESSSSEYGGFEPIDEMTLF